MSIDPAVLEAARAVGSRQISLADMYGLDACVLAKMSERALSQIDGGKVEEGLALLEMLSALQTRDPILAYLCGEFHAKQGNHERAAAAYTEAIMRARALDNDALCDRAQRGRAAAWFAMG